MSSGECDIHICGLWMRRCRKMGSMGLVFCLSGDVSSVNGPVQKELDGNKFGYDCEDETRTSFYLISF